MHVDELQRLYDYHYWANEKLLSAVSQLSPEEFTRPVAGSYGSVRNTLVHILSAEWGWIERCGGPARGERLKADDYPTLESVAVTWKTVEGYMRAFLAGLDDDDLARRIEFTLGSGSQQSALAGEMLQHGAIHAVHHRGQVSLLLRMLGYTPGNYDLLIYAFREPRVEAEAT